MFQIDSLGIGPYLEAGVEVVAIRGEEAGREACILFTRKSCVVPRYEDIQASD